MQRFDASDVYFAFGSGSLGYDCQTCGARCCRGFGYGSRGPELLIQLRRRPHLSLFVASDDGEGPLAHEVQNLPPACFFLTSSGACEIHQQDGYAAKPETCRLFPFNRLARIGRHLIVKPHESLCPLVVQSAGQPSALSDHGILIADLMRAGVNAPIGEYEAASADVDGLLQTERRIQQRAEATYACFSDFGRVQLEESGDDGPERSQDRALRILKAIAEVLGVPVASVDPTDQGLVRTLVGTAATVRALALFRERQAAPSPCAALSPAMASRYSMALAAIAALAWESNMRPVTAQTVIFLSHVMDPLIWLLAHADQTVAWRRGQAFSLQGLDRWTRADAFLDLARSIEPDVQARSPTTLVELLVRSRTRDPHEHAGFLKSVATRLFNRIAPFSAAQSWRRGGFGVIVRSWMLRNCSSALLVRAARSRSSGRARVVA